jgi:hypothetical protein
MGPQAAGLGADLVAICEAAVIGFAGSGDPRRDLGLGDPAPGPATTTLSECLTNRVSACSAVSSA